jgi:hypothetical protein
MMSTIATKHKEDSVKILRLFYRYWFYAQLDLIFVTLEFYSKPLLYLLLDVNLTLLSVFSWEMFVRLTTLWLNELIFRGFFF